MFTNSVSNKQRIENGKFVPYQALTRFYLSFSKGQKV